MDTTPEELAGRYAESKRLLSEGQVAEAEAALQRILAQNPRETQALVGLGTIAAGVGSRDLAIQRMTSALRIDPDCVPALCWMSYLMRLADNPAAAQSYAQRAVELEPRNPATHIALARCLRRLGRFPEAIGAFKTAVELDPLNPGPMYELAETMVGTPMEREAADVLRGAIARSPTPDGLARLARIELDLDQLDAAETHCRAALSMEPDLPQGQSLMARILAEQSRLDEAETYWQRAEAAAPSKSVLSLEKAISFASIGLFDRAREELIQSIDLNPNQGAAYQAYVAAKRIGPEDQAIVGRMESALTNLPEGNERVALLYALGKAYDNLADYERAMKYFDLANALRRRVQGIPPLDRSAFTSLIDTRIKLFSKEFFASRSQGIESSLPLYIFGMIRSGTTLCEQMLSCHSEVYGAGEQYFWVDHEGDFVDYDRGVVDDSKLYEAAEGLLSELHSIAGRPRYVIDKNPINFLFAGTIHAALPNVRMVHTVRNPVDNAISIWTTPIKTDAPFIGDRGDIVFAYREYARLMAHWRDVLPEGTLLEIRYEDLVAQPDLFARRLITDLGLEWQDACLHPDANPRRVKTPSYWQVRQPFYGTSSRRRSNYAPWLREFDDLADLT